MSMLGILILVGLFSFFLMVVIRLLPTYMEGRTVKTAIMDVAAASTASNSIHEVTKRLDSNFNTNRIEALSVRQVKVYRDKGKIVINANYEKRVPLFEGVDAVLMFNDNVVVIN
jgi:magnesium-transporting ATPase (P-type)